MSPPRRRSSSTRLVASAGSQGGHVAALDFAIIGAGPAGEAAAHKARQRGATVAIVDRLWFGGSCPHIGCIPSKSLLDSARRYHENHDAWSWRPARERRRWVGDP